jgi:hypothetical protein
MCALSLSNFSLTLLKKSSILEALPSSVNEQIQENLNKSDFGFGALSQQFLQSEYITTQEIPHFLQQKSLFLFGLDKRIDGKASSIDDFFSKVSEKLDHCPNNHFFATNNRLPSFK